MKYYFASPMADIAILDKLEYSDKRWQRNKKIADQLEKAGFEIYLPQENQLETKEKTLTQEFKMIKECNGLIAVLSDTRGVYLEAGYAKGIGKKIYGLEVDETRHTHDWIQNFFNFIAKDVNELINYLKKNVN